MIKEKQLRGLVIKMKYLRNVSYCITHPSEKKRVKYGHAYYQIAEGDIDDIISDNLSGFQVIPAEFRAKTIHGEKVIRAKECWLSQEIILVEFDKDVPYKSLEEVVENEDFISENAYALTESVRSRYNDPQDDTCNGELRYRAWFLLGGKEDRLLVMQWVIKRLLQEFDNCDQSGSNITNGAYGIKDANKLIIGNEISYEVLKAYADEYKEYIKLRKHNTDIDINDISTLPQEYKEAINGMTFSDYNNMGNERVPCIITNHDKDFWGSYENATVVFKYNNGGIGLYCHKCNESKYFGKKSDKPIQRKRIPKKRIQRKTIKWR